jgi:DNA repair protein RadC
MSENSYHSIKSWAEDDRPREKLLLKGKSALSDAELIAILIGSGSREQSAVDLSKQILASVNNNLNELSRLTIEELMRFKGIGEAKAISIVSALELGRRRPANDQIKLQVKSSQDAFEFMKAQFMDLPHEEFWILLLSRSNKPLEKYMVSRGGVSGTVADLRIIFKKAILAQASSIIVFHNHPSGNLVPSDADKTLTKKIVETGRIVDIQVIDHIIVADEKYYSFADEGIL